MVPKLIRGLLRSGFAMELAKGGARWSYRRENRAFGLWLNFLFDNMKKGFRKERPVAWISAFTPSEIPYAFDLHPFLPEVVACLAAHVGVSERARTEPLLHGSLLLLSVWCGIGIGRIPSEARSHHLHLSPLRWGTPVLS